MTDSFVTSIMTLLLELKAEQMIGFHFYLMFIPSHHWVQPIIFTRKAMILKMNPFTLLLPQFPDSKMIYA